jgi:hypothetical protein
LFQKAGLDHRFRTSDGFRSAEDHPAEGTAHSATEQVFRDDLLKGKHGDPVEDDPPLRSGDARILAIMAAEDRQKEAGNQETVEKPAETGRFFDDLEPPSLT